MRSRSSLQDNTEHRSVAANIVECFEDERVFLVKFARKARETGLEKKRENGYRDIRKRKGQRTEETADGSDGKAWGGGNGHSDSG